jgi:hypothetical protein
VRKEYKLLENHIIISFDHLCKICRLHTGEGGCEELKKDDPGLCRDYACPVAVIADMEDIKKVDPELYKELKEEQAECPQDWENAERTQEGEDYIIPPGRDFMRQIWEVIWHEE